MGYTAAQFVERLEALRSPDATGARRLPRRRHGPDLQPCPRMHGHGSGRRSSACCERSPTMTSGSAPSRIMDFQARDRKVRGTQARAVRALPPTARPDRHLGPRGSGAIWVVGEYLRDKPRDILDHLAASDDPMERRTAILAPSPLSAAISSTTRTGSLSASSTTRTPCTRRSAGCCARPASATRNGRPRSSRRTPRRCRE